MAEYLIEISYQTVIKAQTKNEAHKKARKELAENLDDANIVYCEKR